MPSPFPGMDPYIEGPDWEDFHQGLIVELSTALVPRVRPRYVVRKERRIYVEHPPQDEQRAVRADVAVLSRDAAAPQPEGAATWAGAVAPVIVTLPAPQQRREAYLTVRDGESLELVTVIEVLSPANKRPGGDGRREYLNKRADVLQSDVHLVELDLLRGGLRLPAMDPLPPAHYYAFICRADRRYKAEVYWWSLRDRLGQIPVPLAGEDPDVTIDLQQIFTSTYDHAGYDYSLDYNRILHPPLADDDAEWANQIITSWRQTR